ncbi:MAG: recombinase family protein [Firmicutes bacterium]|nr:recombinase family protein [Bacillota bacterium]
MVFTESPYDRSIEMLMISVPSFKSAGGGRRRKVSIEYTAEMCACKLCLYYKKRKCTAEKCPCLKERIIFADKGLSGTGTKKRKEFNRLMRYCKQGKVDMIITKSVSRFARNTLDCLKYIRMLKELGVDVYFEEQGIHSTQPGAEFYITIYGSIAQSESENMSANIIWGKAQSAKEGNVAFHYKTFLGYRKGADGNPEIDPEQAAVVRRIYERFLAGDSLATIADDLTADGIPTPAGKEKWHRERIASILTNERYKGDAIINKTFIVDCISKKVKVNNGERPKYYVENNHPAIIDPGTFGRVQEEMARRNGKRKVKQLGTKTEQGKYSSKYALTDLLICGECGTPYRRCTWTNNGKKKVVWRCISRLDYGKKHCHNSPSVEESILQEAIMNAIMRTAKQNADVLRTLKLHIGMGLAATDVEDNSLDIQIRIAEIDAEFKAMLQAVATDTMDAFDEEKAGRLMNEKAELQKQLDRISETKQKRENTKSRLEEIFMILEGLNNHPMTYDDKIVRQIIECVVVESKERIKVVFVGGTEVTEPLG